MKIKNVRTIWLAPFRDKTLTELVTVVLFLCACPALGLVEFKDGLTHDIDYIIADTVRVDEEAPLMYTTVNLLPGGRIRDNLEGFGDSRINVLGGTVDDYLTINDYGQLNISDGSLGIIIADGFAYMNISGGSIGNSVYCDGYSQVNISDISILFHLVSSDFSEVYLSGGSIGYQIRSIGNSRMNVSGGSLLGYLESDEQGRITIVGSDFAVDGQSVDYGELTSILGGYCGDEPWRCLTGTLASGEPINNDFRIGEYGKIVLIPEPASVLILGLGGVFFALRRGRR